MPFILAVSNRCGTAFKISIFEAVYLH